MKHEGRSALLASTNAEMLSRKTSFSNAAPLQGSGAGVAGVEAGGGVSGVSLTQHLMSESPGQKSACRSPPGQSLFLTLRQYPEPILGTLHFISTQHCSEESQARNSTAAVRIDVPEHQWDRSGRGRLGRRYPGNRMYADKIPFPRGLYIGR